MRRVLFIGLALTAVFGCTQQQPKVQPPSVRDNLPISDRDLLLEPLERALDDLKENIEHNNTGFQSSQELERGDLRATFDYRLSGKDTLMLVATLDRGGNREKHSWFFDEQKRLFYSEHDLLFANVGPRGEQNHEAFKFYYEEDGSKLSSYGKYSQSKTLPEKWAPVCLSTGKEEMLRSRMQTIRQLVVEE